MFVFLWYHIGQYHFVWSLSLSLIGSSLQYHFVTGLSDCRHIWLLIFLLNSHSSTLASIFNIFITSSLLVTINNTVTLPSIVIVTGSFLHFLSSVDTSRWVINGSLATGHFSFVIIGHHHRFWQHWHCFITTEYFPSSFSIWILSSRQWLQLFPLLNITLLHHININFLSLCAEGLSFFYHFISTSMMPPPLHYFTLSLVSFRHGFLQYQPSDFHLNISAVTTLRHFNIIDYCFIDHFHFTTSSIIILVTNINSSYHVISSSSIK